MFKSLASYSIESDTTVLLTFADGSKSRSNFDGLSDILNYEDLQKVRRGLDLRQRYVRRNLGSVARYLVVASILLLAGYDTVRAEQIVASHHHRSTAPTTSHTTPGAIRIDPVKSVTPAPASVTVPEVVTPKVPSVPPAASTATEATKQRSPIERSTDDAVKRAEQAVTTEVENVVKVVDKVLIQPVAQELPPQLLP